MPLPLDLWQRHRDTAAAAAASSQLRQQQQVAPGSAAGASGSGWAGGSGSSSSSRQIWGGHQTPTPAAAADPVPSAHHAAGQENDELALLRVLQEFEQQVRVATPTHHNRSGSSSGCVKSGVQAPVTPASFAHASPLTAAGAAGGLAAARGGRGMEVDGDDEACLQVLLQFEAAGRGAAAATPAVCSQSA